MTATYQIAEVARRSGFPASTLRFLAFLGGLTIAGLASTLVIGVAGLAIALVAGTAWFIVRRPRRNACRDGAAGGPVSVASPTARAPR